MLNWTTIVRIRCRPIQDIRRQIFDLRMQTVRYRTDVQIMDEPSDPFANLGRGDELKSRNMFPHRWLR